MKPRIVSPRLLHGGFAAFAWMVCLSTLAPMIPAADLPPGFVINANNTFTYTDPEPNNGPGPNGSHNNSFTGTIVVPEGDGPFPAIIVNHGQDGTVSAAVTTANFMAAWGLVGICPELTHRFGPGIDTSNAGAGNSPANRERGQICYNALLALAYVDGSRVAIWGHSKGSYAAIGQAGVLGSAIKAAGLSSGGSLASNPPGDWAAPTKAEADLVATPFAMFVGSLDPEMVMKSADFETILGSHNVLRFRKVYPGAGHNLQTDPIVNDDMLDLFHAWLIDHGVLPALSNATATFVSVAAADGFTTNTTTADAGATNASAIRAGEGASSAQLRGFLSFDTSSLPEGAVIVSAKLRLKQGAEQGTPFGLGACTVDIISGVFGADATLVGTDATAAASATNVGTVADGTNGQTTEVVLAPGAFAFINTAGPTQFRLQFPASAASNRFVGFHSGNSATVANRPELVVEFQQP